MLIIKNIIHLLYDLFYLIKDQSINIKIYFKNRKLSQKKNFKILSLNSDLTDHANREASTLVVYPFINISHDNPKQSYAHNIYHRQKTN